MTPIRLAVIGAGHLGRIHGRLIRAIPDVELVGIVDPVSKARVEVAKACHTTAFAHHQQILNRVDAAILAAPTKYHHQIGVELLNNGIHLFVEKPLTATLAEAAELVDLADRQGVILQVGHVEQFNPALLAVKPHLNSIRYVDANRCGPYTFRSTDVGVVLDLMIHDLDIVLSLANSPIIDVRAVGFSILSEAEDIAQARLEFADGCVANFTASRCSAQPQRTMQVIGKDYTATIDFAQQTAVVMRPGSEFAQVRSEFDGSSTAQNNHWKEHLFEEVLELENLPIEDANAILCEQQEFIDCIRFAHRPTVSGHQAKAALAVAERITNAMSVQAWCDNPAAIDRESVIPVFKHLSAPHQPTIPRRKAG